jgi:hypothetical protein
MCWARGDDEFVNWSDISDGNSVLHAAVARKPLELQESRINLSPHRAPLILTNSRLRSISMLIGWACRKRSELMVRGGIAACDGDVSSSNIPAGPILTASGDG